MHQLLLIMILEVGEVQAALKGAVGRVLEAKMVIWRFLLTGKMV